MLWPMLLPPPLLLLLLLLLLLFLFLFMFLFLLLLLLLVLVNEFVDVVVDDDNNDNVNVKINKIYLILCFKQIFSRIICSFCCFVISKQIIIITTIQIIKSTPKTTKRTYYTRENLFKAQYYINFIYFNINIIIIIIVNNNINNNMKQEQPRNTHTKKQDTSRN